MVVRTNRLLLPKAKELTEPKYVGRTFAEHPRPNERLVDASATPWRKWHPQAFHWVEGVRQTYIPRILSRYVLFWTHILCFVEATCLNLDLPYFCSVARECGKETVLSLLATRPDVILVDPCDRVPSISNTPTGTTRPSEETTSTSTGSNP